ncbi:hypothetical protein LTR84_004708 [Exophiala bonariae]|uniref:Cytochrome P450 n=1 Tax=Exophiala bonariae TaxID=1690606 RepID=A0AAV9NN69_9EURO|nr:hypothetical protein LTR84_004708 [Exophiala bonariae]
MGSMGIPGSDDCKAFDDPVALFHDLEVLRSRENFPHSPRFDARVISRYDDIVTILDRPDIFSSGPTVPHPPSFIADKISSKCPMRGTLLGLDNPIHDRLRRSVSSFFVPRRLKRFEPVIETLAHQVVDTFVESSEINIKSAFALPLPLQIISLIVGLDPKQWQWVGRSLALFGGHAEYSSGTLDEKVAGIIELHEHIADLIQLRKADRRDDLISHIWNERDSGVVEMTDFEHLSMIPGLLLAGHETTTNLLTMGLSHLLHRNLWHQANKDDRTRAATIEELVRYESAITGMKREVLREFKLRETTMYPGDNVFLAYNSGSRDPQIFQDADELILTRKFTTQHLGFGRGIHACLGAPLARLLLRVEMRVLYERLPNLCLVTPYGKRKYDPVHEGCGIAALTVSWQPSKPVTRKLRNDTASLERAQASRKIIQQEVVVESIIEIADKVLEITFVGQNGARMPTWAPGAHIDVPVGTFGHRQYSLCGSPADEGRYTVAVLREGAESTGGSQFIHDTFARQKAMMIRGPRNHFELRPATKYIFIAGGIGITAIKPMIETVKTQGHSYRAVYLGSSRSKMAYVKELSMDPCVKIWPKDEADHRFNLSSLSCKDTKDLLIYCCGPARLLAAVEELFRDYPTGILNIERFENTSHNLDASLNRPFDVLLQRSDRQIHVPADRTLLEVLNEEGVGVMSTCSKGTCGTCEVSVLEGVPEHRDTVLTAVERLDGKTMMPCVSRCIGSKLTLDLW